MGRKNQLNSGLNTFVFFSFFSHFYFHFVALLSRLLLYNMSRMKILAVDNYKARLSQLEATLRDIFPNDEIMAIADPFYAVQYSAQCVIDMAFVERNMLPLNGFEVSGLIRKFNENTKVYLTENGLMGV